MAMDQVEEIKQKVDILELIGSRVNLKKAGRHYKGLCPFHSEKSPSFIVSPERQSYKCFGCGEGGDVYTFLQKYEGMSFLEALEQLSRQVGITLTSYRPTAEDAQRKKMFEIHQLASEYYKYILHKHESGKIALEYLKKRGITKEAIDNFGLGYSPSQWRSVSEFLTKKKGYSEEDLVYAGITIRSDNGRYYDRFRGRVMFPLKDHRGQVVGFSGRTISGDTTEAKYINSPETSIYHKGRMLYGLWENKEYIRKTDSLILVEGELDVLPSWQANVKNVAAIKGSAFTEEMGQLIARYTRNVAMSLDSDSAGQEAIKRAVKVAEPLDLSIRVVQITGGKDPGDVATENPGSWREMTKKAVLYWDFLIDSLMSKNDPSSGEGTKAISTEVIPALAEITNLVVQAHYVQDLSKRLKVPESSVYDEIERVKKKKELSGLRTLVKKIETGEAKGRKEKLEELILAMSLQHKNELGDKVQELEPEWFTGSAKKIVMSLLSYQGKFEIKSFASKLPPELQEMIDKTYLMDLTQYEDIKKEFAKSMYELKGEYLRERMKQITLEIGKAEKEGQEEVLVALQKEFGILSRKLSEVSG